MLQAESTIYDDSIIVKFDTITDNGLNVLICSFTDSVDYSSYIAEEKILIIKIMKILKDEQIELAYDTKTIQLKKIINRGDLGILNISINSSHSK